MTISDRTAVIDFGELQQVDPLIGCYNESDNLFDAASGDAIAHGLVDVTSAMGATVRKRALPTDDSTERDQPPMFRNRSR